ncbi:MAG: ATP-binding protein [Anaerolineae bacterium]
MAQTQSEFGPNRMEAQGEMFRSIRTRLILSFSLLFIAILLLVGVVDVNGVPLTTYTGRQGQQRIETFQSLDLIADLKKERLLRWIEERRDDSEVAASNDFTVAHTAHLLETIQELRAQGKAGAELWAALREEESYGSLEKYLERIRVTYGVYNKIELAAAETGAVFLSTNVNDQGTDISQEAYFSGALRSRDDYVSDIKLDALSGQPTLHFSHVVVDEDGTAIAVLVMEVNADDIIKPILHTGEGLGERGEALLVNQEVKILTSLKHPLPDGNIASPLEYQIEAQAAVLAASGEEGIIETEDYRGERVLAAYRHLRLSSEQGWGLVVKRDRAELFAPLRRELLFSILFAVGGMVALVGLTIVTANGLTRPILLLSQTAERVARGDLEAQAPVTSSDEVGALAATFNMMVRRVRNWRQELAEQVQARTAELEAANRALTREIEERRRAEAELERLNRALTGKNKELEQIVYVTSHDLRSPLVNIQGFSRELERAVDQVQAALAGDDVPATVKAELAGALAEDIPESLRFISASTAKMDALLAGLLRLSRLGRAALDIRPLDMNHLMAAIAGAFEFQIKEAGVTLRIDHLPSCLGDETQINQVFSNLLDNALKYRHPNRLGIIRVSGSRKDKTVVYCIEDNGIGIAAEYQSRIYDMFHRLDPDAVPGEGLGLTIARRILDRHGGRIWLESEPGRGSKFCVSLPGG